MTAPDPKVVREVALKAADYALHDSVSMNQWITAVARGEIGVAFDGWDAQTRFSFHAAVARRLAVVKPWWPGEDLPDEPLQDEPEPPRLFTDVDRDTTPYLRVRAFITAATQAPDTNGQGIASVIDSAGIRHVLTEQDVEDVLDDHGEMQNEIDRLIGKLAKTQPQDGRDGDVQAVAQAVVRLKAWLVGRQANVHSEISSTSVIAEPRDRSTATWAIAESDVAAVVAALDARDAKAPER